MQDESDAPIIDAKSEAEGSGDADYAYGNYDDDDDDEDYYDQNYDSPGVANNNRGGSRGGYDDEDDLTEGSGGREQFGSGVYPEVYPPKRDPVTDSPRRNDNRENIYVVSNNHLDRDSSLDRLTDAPLG